MPASEENRPAHEGPPRPARLLLGALAAVGVYLSCRILQPFATAILWAGVLALIFKPLDRWLLARTGRANLAAALTLGVALICVLLPVAAVSVAMAHELGTFLDEAPARWGAWLEAPGTRERLANLQADLVSRFPFAASFDLAAIERSFSALGEKAMRSSLAFAGNLVQGAARFVVIAFTLFFLLRDSRKFEEALRHLLPLTRPESDRLLARTAEIVHASVVGVVAVACVQGAIGGLTFAVLGLPSPVLWGVAMAFLAMVPMVGAGIVWVPAAILLLVTGETGKAIALALVGALVISTIDNFLRPRLVGGRTGLHELVVFFAVLGALDLFGLVGLLVGPALLALTWALLDLFRGRGSGAQARVLPRAAPLAVQPAVEAGESR